MRKIIQIAASGDGANARMFALCDDGTLWWRWVAGNGAWQLAPVDDVVNKPVNNDLSGSWS